MTDDPLHKLLDGADLAPATRRAYLTDWRAFTTWTAQHHRRPLPADLDTIVCWLTARPPTATRPQPLHDG